MFSPQEKIGTKKPKKKKIFADCRGEAVGKRFADCMQSVKPLPTAALRQSGKALLF